MRPCGCQSYGCVAAILTALASAKAGPSAGFNFHRDTPAFANSTVFGYEQGRIVSHSNPSEKGKPHRYTRRCFVMTRTVEQFYKFSRFDPKSPALNDAELTKRVRAVTRMHPWLDPLPPEKQIVFPGYHNLREMSAARAILMQKNIGLGWVAYLRVGNFRMFYLHSKEYQQKTHDELEQTLARGEFFCAYLSDFPILHINHSVLVYTHDGTCTRDGIDRYLVYDSNHPDGPRHLKWFSGKREFDFEKDQEFVGGFTRVFHIYGKAFQ